MYVYFHKFIHVVFYHSHSQLITTEIQELAMYQVKKMALISVLAIAAINAYWYCTDSTLFLMYDLHVMDLNSTEMHQTALNEQYLQNNIGMQTISKEISHDNIKPTSHQAVHLTKPFNEQSPTPQEGGYIFPYSIYEEQTNGAKNLWQLQVFAKQVGMHVVEPFAKDSWFTMADIAPNFIQALRFGDYVDIDKWNHLVTRDGGNPLIQWKEFITKAPRKAIILYTDKHQTIRMPLTTTYDKACKVERQIATSDLHWIRENFDVIKTVCYLCATHKPHALSIKEFVALVLADSNLQPDEASLIIVNWLGIRKTRVHLLPIKMFTTVLHRKFTFPPSKRVMAAYKAYVQHYIGDHKYVGIIFRTHHVMYFSPLKGSFTNQSKYLLQCSKCLSDVLDKVRNRWKIFLAYDMGLFGSINYVKDKRLVPLQKQIFLDVFNGSLQVNEREEHLIKAANGTTDRGVIALLEKVIATNADCIILLGQHSTFVQSAGKLYASIHQTNSCIVSICFEPVYDNKKRLISSHSIPDHFLNT